MDSYLYYIQVNNVIKNGLITFEIKNFREIISFTDPYVILT